MFVIYFSLLKLCELIIILVQYCSEMFNNISNDFEIFNNFSTEVSIVLILSQHKNERWLLTSRHIFGSSSSLTLFLQLHQQLYN